MGNNDSFPAVFSDLMELWRKAPSPVRFPTGDWTREDKSRAAVVALSWGWLVRMIRSAEAALLLQQNGFRQEAAPLERTALEHSMRLHWAITARTTAFEIALRTRSASIHRMKKAQSDSWSFTDEQLATMDAEVDEASQDFQSLDNLQHLKHVVDQDPALKASYMAWLKLSQLSHPTIESARPYYEKMSSDPGYELHMEPLHPADSVESRMAHAVMLGLVGYASIAGLNDHFLDAVGRLAARWTALVKGDELGV
ncbi:hypothetical protein LJ754_03175 [Arthrobacter sp. zg-Y40]|uniref:DUF5677 domain-containing protein n=1 Tax=Arthrobacter sp. zg-Y40 TaxID=2886939 RepID=UPI001D142A6F|nr:DUF5677 domain-containing protein [Arthrobacter sp. zg-Y40]MCC3278162.1 hypothetical protein [Arthrobacter sp. zg-Y40]